MKTGQYLKLIYDYDPTKFFEAFYYNFSASDSLPLGYKRSVSDQNYYSVETAILGYPHFKKTGFMNQRYNFECEFILNEDSLNSLLILQQTQSRDITAHRESLIFGSVATPAYDLFSITLIDGRIPEQSPAITSRATFFGEVTSNLYGSFSYSTVSPLPWSSTPSTSWWSHYPVFISSLTYEWAFHELKHDYYNAKLTAVQMNETPSTTLNVEVKPYSRLRGFNPTSRFIL